MSDGTLGLADIAAIGSGGMGHAGGWMGAGAAKIPMECFTKAAAAFRKKYF